MEAVAEANGKADSAPDTRDLEGEEDGARGSLGGSVRVSAHARTTTPVVPRATPPFRVARGMLGVVVFPSLPDDLLRG